MNNNGKGLRNIVLISQISICVMVPMFMCLALGLWLDGKFGTWFTLPLLVLGILAGGRNAYVLAMNTIQQEEVKRKKQQQEEIDAKVARYNEQHGNSESK